MLLLTWFPILAFPLLKFALGATYNDPSQLPTSNEYDYVVIGGRSVRPANTLTRLKYAAAGIGGSVVASRLSEDPHRRVLVIEAGPRCDATRALVRDIGADIMMASDVGIEAIEVPFLCVGLSPNTPLNWNYTTVPQPGLNGRTISYPRGRVVGGSSSISQSVCGSFPLKIARIDLSHT